MPFIAVFTLLNFIFCLKPLSNTNVYSDEYRLLKVKKIKKTHFFELHRPSTDFVISNRFYTVTLMEASTCRWQHIILFLPAAYVCLMDIPLHLAYSAFYSVKA